jgi:methionine-rich copper-binding protein CopC
MTPVRLAGAAVIAAALLGWAAAPAAAHSELVSSDPANGASLPAVPPTATLTFNENIAGEFTSVAVTIGSEAPAPAAATTVGPAVTVDLAAALAALPPDAAAQPGPVAWTVAYRVVSADGHPIQGQIGFTAPLPAAPTPTPAPTPSASPASEPTPTASDLAAAAAAEPVEPSDTGGSATPWLVGGAALIAVGAVGGVAFARRRTVSS